MDGSRPYQDSALIMQEIIDSGPPQADPRRGPGLYWEVEGSLMVDKRINVVNPAVPSMSGVVYQLLISPDGKTIWHFLFYGR